MWAYSVSHVWAVGLGGHVSLYNGDTWEQATTPTQEDLYSVSGTQENDVFAVGANGVSIFKHYSGQWRLLHLPFAS